MCVLVILDEQNRTLTDEDIYLSEKRFEQPKEIFKLICSVVKNHNFPQKINICDIGCATGEFLHHFKSIFSQCSVTGLDVSKPMLDVAKKMLSVGNFLLGNINSEQPLPTKSFDVITMTGVLGIFDNPQLVLTNCLSAIKKNGVIIIANPFNPYPIDAIVRYRRSDKSESTWETGWNIHSCYTIEKIIKDIAPDAKLTWHDFQMPFSIKQTSDFMRTWTTKIENNNHMLINGACQILHIKILEICI